MKYNGFKNGKNQFLFICENCCATGDLGVTPNNNLFGCPENCGATYVQYQNMDGKPDLKCVVKPILDGANTQGHD